MNDLAIRLRQAGAIACAVVTAGVVSGGCGSSPGPSGDAPPACISLKAPLALAIGARANNPAPALTPAVTTLLNSAVDAYKTVTLVRLDGQPKVVFSQALSPGANTQTTKQAKDKYVANLNRVLAGTSQQATDIRAQVQQADPLDALAVAASTVPAGGDVIMMDSGLQTSEPLDFRTGLLSDDPRSIVEFLRQANELPDLKGRHVYFVGLGWTASPQPALSISNRAKVVEIWKEIARAAGATCVATDETANTRSAVANRPPVAIVKPPPPPRPVISCAVVNLGDANHVGFIVNSTTFRDPSGARTTLGQIAKLMLRTGESVTLTGSTSSEGTDQYNNRLSLRRAEAVKAVLLQLGVPAARISAIGDGSHLPGRVNDRGPNGTLLIGPAIEDRKVVAKLTGPKCRNS
jgi:outer membrane protein OmpA-like peptidoglycan-associated protein